VNHFTKTGSGQTQRKTQKRLVFSQRIKRLEKIFDTVPGDKTVFFRHLYIKMMILPRQARDKHRENSKKEAVLLQ
jgi:hypothetical protein